LADFIRRLPYFAITVAVIAADQASKLWAHSVLRVKPNQTLEVIRGFFNFSYAENPGIAFSLFNSGAATTKAFLLGIACVAAIGLTVYMLRTPPSERRLLATLGLILGGVAGNALDRVTYGAVIDFLDVFVGASHWPTFNIADSAICVGAVVLAIDALLGLRTGAPAEAESSGR
jgi:signal peptidase II